MQKLLKNASSRQNQTHVPLSAPISHCTSPALLGRLRSARWRCSHQLQQQNIQDIQLWNGSFRKKKITLSVKNTLTCQPVVQQVSVSAERSGISAVLSNQTHTVIFWHQTRKEKKFPHSLPSPCLGSERCMNACSAPTAAQRFARRYYSLWGKTRQSFLYDMNIITLYCYADIPRVIVLE